MSTRNGLLPLAGAVALLVCPAAAVQAAVVPMHIEYTATGERMMFEFEEGTPYEPPPAISRMTVDGTIDTAQLETDLHYLMQDAVVRLYALDDPNEVIYETTFYSVPYQNVWVHKFDTPTPVYEVEVTMNGQDTIWGPSRYDISYNFAQEGFFSGDPVVGTPATAFDFLLFYSTNVSVGQVYFLLESVTATATIPEPASAAVSMIILGGAIAGSRRPRRQ
jgi:hypothetical protein